MATCPDCKSKQHMSLDRTGKSRLIAKKLGTFSLAGAQMKVSAFEVAVMLLACDTELGGCGWSVEGYIDDEGYLVALSDSNT